MEKKKFSWIKYSLLWILMIGVLAVFLKPTKSIHVSTSEQGLTIEAADEFELEIIYGEIEDISYVEEFSYGTLEQGYDGEKLKWGIWKNEALSEYEMIISPTIKAWIIIETKEKKMVLNYESVASTYSLYQAILKEIA